MMRETPSIASAATNTVAYGLNAGGLHNLWRENNQDLGVRLTAGQFGQNLPFNAAQPHMEKTPMANAGRRLVQVFIADPDENVPMADCLLFKGEQKLTDLTDQELFFEVDIKSILDKHNEKRVKLVNKKVKERTEHLEPVKIRDLKMVVVNVAQF
jgi:hypothetical protein